MDAGPLRHPQWAIRRVAHGVSTTAIGSEPVLLPEKPASIHKSRRKARRHWNAASAVSVKPALEKYLAGTEVSGDITSGIQRVRTVALVGDAGEMAVE